MSVLLQSKILNDSWGVVFLLLLLSTVRFKGVSKFVWFFFQFQLGSRNKSSSNISLEYISIRKRCGEEKNIHHDCTRIPAEHSFSVKNECFALSTNCLRFRKKMSRESFLMAHIINIYSRFVFATHRQKFKENTLFKRIVPRLRSFFFFSDTPRIGPTDTLFTREQTRKQKTSTRKQHA